MKKIKTIGACLFLIWGSGVPQVAWAAEGSTTLEILPLKETYPRLISVSDLDFGGHGLQETGKPLHPKEDLVMEIFDGRMTTTPWELQVAWSPLTTTTQQELAVTAFTLGVGTVTTTETAKIEGIAVTQLAAGEYQSILRSSDQPVAGKVSYRIPKEAITLSFATKQLAGSYQGSNHWRFINAKLSGA